LRLEKLEDRLLLTLAPADDASEMPPDALLATCPVNVGRDLPAPAAADSAPLLPAASTGSSLSVPAHHSDPTAKAKLFLDFDGHVEANWGRSKNVRTPAFDQDGNVASFSSSELAAIDEIWARVAEDFVPFQIDVTTVDPGSYAHGVVAVIAIGGDYSDWYKQSAGGVAYVSGFSDPQLPNVGYVFSTTLDGVPSAVADAASHEAGHLFGLNHQAVWFNGDILQDEYNPGNGDWAPLMGVSYDAVRSTWYNGAPDTSGKAKQDDMAIIAGRENGFGYRPDDFGNTIQDAGALPIASANVNLSGLIGQNDDRDVWRFTTGTALVSFQISGAAYGPNLEGELELWNSSGSVIASSDSSLNSSVTVTVGPGTYYLVAHGAGDYGDVGQYSITGSLVPVTAPEIQVSVSGNILKDGGTLDFGNTTIGQPVLKTVTVTNVGNATLTLVPFPWNQLFGAVTLVSSLGDSALDPGESTSFTLQLDAMAQTALADSIQLISNDSDDGSFEIHLRGTVNPPNVPEIDVSGDTDFGGTMVGMPVAHTFTVTNLGTAPLVLVPLDGSTLSGFTLVSNLGSTVLNVGESTNFAIRLDATAAGNVSGLVALANNDLDESHLQLNLRGVVDAPPAPEIDLALDIESIWDGGRLDFGSTIQGDAVSMTLTVINLGNIWLHLTPLNPAGMPSGFSLVSNIDSTSLAPGESTTFTIRFNAASVGFTSGVMHLANDDSDEGSYDVTLSGRGLAPVQQVVDDGDDANILNGQWRRPTGAGYARDTHYSARGNGAKFSSWYFNVPQGQYRVYATWTWNKHNASNAPFTMLDEFRTVGFVRVNQRVAPGPQSSIGRWRLLGTVAITDWGLTVKLTNAANGYVIADAVRIEQAAGLRSPPEIVNWPLNASILPSLPSTDALGQVPAGAPVFPSSNRSLLPRPATTPVSSRQLTALVTAERATKTQAAGTSEQTDAQAIDGLLSSTPERETDSYL
jgi:HYDIN/CFA65/VesB family protein